MVKRIVLGLLAIGFLNPALGEEPNTKALGYMAVQDGGRVKPFDTYARESLRLMHGRETFKTTEGKKIPARDLIFTILLAPDMWQKSPLFQVRHSGLREALKLTEQKEIYHSAEELLMNERLPLLIQEVRSKREKKEKLDPYYQAVSTLESQLSLFQGLRAGSSLRVWPQGADAGDAVKDPNAQMQSTLWKAVAELDGESKDAFLAITKAFAGEIGSATDKAAEEGSAAGNLKAAVDAWNQLIDKTAASENKPDAKKISTEVHYNNFHPFQKAWIIFLIALVFLISFSVTGRELWWKIGLWGSVVGFVLSTYGLILRVYLTGRPPVSNMFETVVWVPMVAMIVAFFIATKGKIRVALTGAVAVSILCLILCDFAPAVLDDSLHPLEPVLRDNFWLVTHVMVIVSSYGAFFLAFALGDLALYYYIRDEKKNAKKIADIGRAIYRSIQIGVLLLAAGTILGGVWADYSWGRFWGWDPKETWAFIALMGYLALLHGRLTTWLKDFGTAVGAVIGFNLVIMAWYGVNFVLGAGLHTYGFGAGGVEYVAAFCAVHLLFVAYVVTARQTRQMQTK